MRVKRNPAAALFTVEDNGFGFDTAQIRSPDDPHRGLGLAVMEERVRMQGGTLKIISRENQGTRIAFTLPLGSGRENERLLHHAGRRPHHVPRRREAHH